MIRLECSFEHNTRSHRTLQGEFTEAPIVAGIAQAFAETFEQLLEEFVGVLIDSFLEECKEKG